MQVERKEINKEGKIDKDITVAHFALTSTQYMHYVLDCVINLSIIFQDVVNVSEFGNILTEFDKKRFLFVIES